MADTKDINSTEKLLNVIRGVEQPSANPADAEITVSSPKRKTSKNSLGYSGLFSGRHHIKIGVDIGPEYINFAKMAKTSDGAPLLIDQKILKIDDDLKKDSAAFNNVLKSSLTAFAGSLADCDVWAMMNAAEVNVYHLKIPRVPKKQLENAVYWTAKKENPIDEKDVIFDYEVQGEIIDQGIPKYAVMAYSTPRSEVAKVEELFGAVGVDLAGMTIAPFAIQNIFRTRWVNVGENTFASLFIGNDFSRIDIYNKNNLVMTRGIKTGISSMMEAIDESIAEMTNHPKTDKKSFRKILYELSENPGTTIKDEEGRLWTERSVLEMITPAMERLARQIDRTLEYYASSVGYEKVEKIYVSSVLNVFYVPILNYVSEQLSAASEFFDPLKGKDESVSGARLPFAERASLVPVIGLSLSDRMHTPNALFTYVEKKKEAWNQTINRGIFATFAAALIICLMVLSFEVLNTNRLNDQRIKLEQELSLFKPILSKEKVDALAKGLRDRSQINKQYSAKYQGMALIGELSFLTPSNVRLISLKMSMPVAAEPRQNKESAQKEKEEGVIIEGVVLGGGESLDALLSQYVLKLENSLLLHSVVVQKSSLVNFKKKEILQFTIKAKIG